MHQLRGWPHHSAERIGDRLVAETDPQDGDPGVEVADNIGTDSACLGVARSRGDHYCRGVKRLQFSHRHPVVAIHR